MVTTVSRVLAALLAAVFVLLCAPTAPAAAETRAPERSPAIAEVGPAPHAVVGPASDSASIAAALAKWSGDQRAPTRDLPEVHTPPPVAAPGPGQAWLLVPPPDSGRAPHTGHGPALPPGRAPPLTTLA